MGEAHKVMTTCILFVLVLGFWWNPNTRILPSQFFCGVLFCLFVCVLFSLYNLIDVHLHCVVAAGEKTKLACLLVCV